MNQVTQITYSNGHIWNAYGISHLQALQSAKKIADVLCISFNYKLIDGAYLPLKSVVSCLPINLN
jgi:hypothetical protein